MEIIQWVNLHFTDDNGNLRKGIKQDIQMELRGLTQDHFRYAYGSLLYRQNKCINYAGECYEKE